MWISTDNELIAQEARRYNANVHYRTEYSARDEATSIESIQEFLSGHLHIKNIALIQCTSVFISEHYLEAAVRLFHRRPSVDCVFSVHRKVIWKWMILLLLFRSIKINDVMWFLFVTQKLEITMAAKIEFESIVSD